MCNNLIYIQTWPLWEKLAKWYCYDIEPQRYHNIEQFILKTVLTLNMSRIYVALLKSRNKIDKHY